MQPKDAGTPLEQLQARQEATLEGCEELGKRMWQHLAHRQEKINSNLDALARLYDVLDRFNFDDLTALLLAGDPETKKRLLEDKGDADSKRWKVSLARFFFLVSPPLSSNNAAHTELDAADSGKAAKEKKIEGEVLSIKIFL